MKKIIIIFFFVFTFNTLNVYASDFDIVKFKRCIDGDTAAFILNDKEIKVRFLAIDTPETVDPSKDVDPIGLLASEYTCNKIKNAKEIKLEYDSDSDKFDKYNRLLAWIWVDDTLIQKELISKGYAKTEYIYGDYIYLKELYNLEEISKSKKLGIWNIEPVTYEVIFKIDNDLVIKNINKNEKVQYFIPYKKGFTFIKWNYNKKEFDFNNNINKDIELVAIFEKDNIFTNILFILFSLFILYLTNNNIFKKKLKNKKFYAILFI